MEFYNYQVWVLTDDLEKANGQIVEKKIMETDHRGVAIWFAQNYPFEKIDNTVIRVEKVVLNDIGDAECADIEYEKSNNRE